MSGPSYIWKILPTNHGICESNFVILESNQGKLILCQWLIELGDYGAVIKEIPVKACELEAIRQEHFITS